MAAAAAVIGVCEAAGWPFLREPVARRMAQAFGAGVRIEGDFRARLIVRPRIEASSLHIGAANGVAVPHLLQAGTVVFGWRWSDLRRWRRGEPLHLRELRAATLDAHLKRGADGRASWQLGAAPERKSADSDAALPTVGTLEVGRGQLHIDDALLALKLEVGVEGAERAERARPAAGETPVGLRATAKGRYREFAVDLQAKAERALPLVGEAGTEPDVPVTLAGSVGRSRVSFVGSAGDLLGAQRLNGALLLRGPSLSAVGDPLGVTLPRTPPFEIDGRLSHAQGVWTLKAPKLHVGQSRLVVDVNFDTRLTPPLLTGRIDGGPLRLADLGPAIGTSEGTAESGTPAPTPTQGAGRVLPDRRFDLPSLRAMNADLALSIDPLDLGTEALAEVRELRTQLRLTAGVLTLEQLQARVGGGRIAGRSALDARNNAALWSTDLSATGLRLENSVPAVRRAGNAAPYATGELRFTLKATGQGRSTAEILSTLDGRLQAQLRAGTISHLLIELAGLDIAQALGVAVSGDKPLALNCALLDARIDKGIVTPRRALADTRDSTLRAAGAVDLRNEQIGLRVTVKPKDISPLSLRAPILIGGTLSDPTVGIEAKRLAPRLAAALALSTIAGPAALLPLIEMGEKGEDPCAAAAAAATQKPK